VPKKNKTSKAEWMEGYASGLRGLRKQIVSSDIPIEEKRRIMKQAYAKSENFWNRAVRQAELKAGIGAKSAKLPRPTKKERASLYKKKKKKK
jgi:ABC-type Fe2+-enterobactin transport system substrate-binding protein